MSIAVTVVRTACEADLPAILAISNGAAERGAANFAVEPEPIELWRASWQETHRTHPWLVACAGGADGAIIAFAKASPHRGRCAYHWTAEVTVYVEPEHHGRGIGRALYAQLIPQLEQRGFRTLLAGIALPNPASVALHERFGFQRVGTFHKVGWKFGRWHDVGYWELAIGGDEPPEEDSRFEI